MGEKLIEHMVQRFLGWRLPEDFRPDAGISFTAPIPMSTLKHEPMGTNLFDAIQAEVMVRYILEGAPDETPALRSKVAELEEERDELKAENERMVQTLEEFDTETMQELTETLGGEMGMGPCDYNLTEAVERAVAHHQEHHEREKALEARARSSEDVLQTIIRDADQQMTYRQRSQDAMAKLLSRLEALPIWTSPGIDLSEAKASLEAVREGDRQPSAALLFERARADNALEEAAAWFDRSQARILDPSVVAEILRGMKEKKP